MCRLLLSLMLLLGLANLGTADLVWEQVEQRVKHRAEEMTLRTSFKCRNAGSTIVEIKSAKSCCGCVTVKATKTTIGAGETAEIQAGIDRKGRGTNFTKILLVTTSNGRTQILTIRIEQAS